MLPQQCGGGEGDEGVTRKKKPYLEKNNFNKQATAQQHTNNERSARSGAENQTNRTRLGRREAAQNSCLVDVWVGGAGGRFAGGTPLREMRGCTVKWGREKRNYIDFFPLVFTAFFRLFLHDRSSNSNSMQHNGTVVGFDLFGCHGLWGTN